MPKAFTSSSTLRVEIPWTCRLPAPPQTVPARPSYAAQGAKESSYHPSPWGPRAPRLPPSCPRFSAYSRCAETLAPGRALVTGSAYVLLNLHLHEGLRERPHALFEKFGVAFDLRLARKSSVSPILSSSAIVMVSSYSVDWSLPKEPHGGRPRQRPRFLTHLRGHYPNKNFAASIMNWLIS